MNKSCIGMENIMEPESISAHVDNTTGNNVRILVKAIGY